MEPKTPKRTPRSGAFLRFSGMAFTMAGSIGMAVWLGRKWDLSSGHEFPLGTLLGGVLGTVAAIWMVIKELSK